MRKNPVVMIVFVVLLSLAFCTMALAGCGESKDESSTSGDGGNGNTATGGSGGNPADIAACQANLRTIDSAIAQYKAVEGKDPKSINDLVPNYLRSVPKEPTGGTYSISGGKAVCSKGHKI